MKVRNKVFISFIILTATCFSSCASILNEATQEITILKDERIDSVKIDSVQQLLSGDTYHVLRSKNPLKLSVKIDSAVHPVKIEPYSSLYYWMNIYTWGIGYWLEKDNPKRYSYQKDVFLEVIDSNINVLHFKPVEKGKVVGVISFPLLNHHYLQTFDGKKIDGGILGLVAGAEFYYKKNIYLSSNIGISLSFDPVEYTFFEGSKQNSYNVFLNVLNNHVFDNYEISYGVNVSRIQWIKSYEGDIMPGDDTRTGNITSLSVGPSLNVFKRMSKNIRLGLLYQPTFFKKNPDWQYDYRFTSSFGITANFTTNLKF